MALLKINGQWYQSTKSGKPRKVKVRHGRAFRTKKGRIGCYVYVNNKRVGFEPMPRYSSKNYDYPERRY